MALASLIVSIIVALVVVYRDFLRDLVFRPSLRIEFSLDEPISRETTIKYGIKSNVDPGYRQAFWLRLRITNEGRTVAKKCEGILSEIREYGGSVHKKYDPLTLRWAIAPLVKGLEPIDIAPSRSVDLNTIVTIEGETHASFATHDDLTRGIPLGLEPGKYWLRITIFGDNFDPVHRWYAVNWDGKNFKEIQMKEVQDYKSGWPW